MPFASLSQQNNLPLNRELNLSIERAIAGDSLSIFTGFRPLIESQSYTLPQVCGFRGLNWGGGICTRDLVVNKNFGSWLKRKIWYENFLIVKDSADDFHLTIDPLFNFQFGRDLEDTASENVYTNTRGLLVRGNIGKKFSFETSFYENQSTLPQFYDDYAKGSLVVPGQGRWKVFKKTGYDYAMASGNISWTPSKYFNIQAGHGKHFVGDGYRSLLLSDNAFNYPYLRVTTSYRKFQYTNLYAVFMNLTDGGVNTPKYTERLFQKKAASMQYLSWNAHKRLQLGLFQALIWEATDTLNKMHLDLSYFNPVILGSAAEYGLGGAKNVILGATWKLRLPYMITAYGQYMLDDIAEDFINGSIANKQGFQTGVKVQTIKGLTLQWEYNQVRPYTYAHKKNSQSYSHYNQALAHPLGANFREMNIIVDYRIGNFFVQVKALRAGIGRDSLSLHYGNNIFVSDNDAMYGVHSTINEQNQGVQSQLDIIDLKLGLVINPSTNMNIVLGYSMRKEDSSIAPREMRFVYAGFRTSLGNVYWDF